MKFIHAADIHLDSPLAGLRSRADLPADTIHHCTRRAFAALIDLALAEDVAFVIIAGDLYDGDWKDFSTGLFFAEQMRRLGRPCYLLRGNHDARSLITRNLTLPPNVREFSSRTTETFFDEARVALHGRSFPNRAVTEDLSATYPAPEAGWLNIGVLHTSAEDPGEHETYAPCRIGDLVVKGYDYWALGHIHKGEVLSKNPWIVFPGNIQGRHPNETGSKGCSLVTVEDGRIVSVEHRPLDVVRWEGLTLDVTGLDVATLTGRLEEVVGAAVATADSRPLLARLTLTGRTDLHAALAEDTERLAAECRNIAIAAGGALWIESVRVLARPAPASDEAALAPLSDAFAAGLDDPDLRAALLRDFADVRQRLPAHIRTAVDLPATEDELRTMAADAWGIVAAALEAQRG